MHPVCWMGSVWALAVFISAITVRGILLRPRPRASTPAPAQAKESVKPSVPVTRR